MHAPRRSALLALVVLAAGLSGCMGNGGSESTDDNDTNGTNGTVVTTPPTTTTNGTRAHFQISEIEILAADGRVRTLYEDDANATLRYTVSQPEDAPAETAFVSYILNGKLMHAEQIRLAPGQEKTYERLVEGLRESRTIRVEVRAGSAVAKNETTVQDWPRAGYDALRIGPLTVRADYGLLEQDGKVLVNLTLVNDGAEEIEDFRVKMLCASPDGEIQTTRSIDTPAPTPGNRTGVDVLVEDCGDGELRSGHEAKGRDSTGELWGRLLLVPKGWAPADASGTA